MANFTGIFFVALTICAAITFLSSEFYKQKFKKAQDVNAEDEISPEVKERHTKLLKKYLFVYLLAVLSDWLQGPYVYALYMEYGFAQHEIAELFVAGFGSSMVFGSFIGGMADSGGRRTFVIIFAAVYAASCITKRKFSPLVCDIVSFSFWSRSKSELDSIPSLLFRLQGLRYSDAWKIAWRCRHFLTVQCI